jgi:hypothetical protein
MGVTLTVAGVVLLAAFAWFVWPPLVLAALGSGSLAAGLLIDWEAIRGESADTPPGKE